MSLSVLITGFLLVFVSLCIHVTVWRWHCPKNDALALIVSFLILPVTIILIAIVFRVSGIVSTLNNILTPINLSYCIFLYLALSAVYVVSYPAAQAMCPSLTILLIVAHAMPRGCTQEEIQGHFSNSGLLDTRVQDLIDAKLAKEVDGMLTLTPSGVATARFFVFYRRLLGLPMGDG